jgi:Domain of unknown function (DUF929)
VADNPKRLNSLLVVVAVALVAVVAFGLTRRHNAVPAATPSLVDTPVPDSVMAAFAAITPAIWEQAGTANAAPPIFVGDADTAAARPQFLYIGSLYCPYCAAARWSVIAALSRFGRFTGLSYSASAAEDVYPSTPTFSFMGSTYTSPFVEFHSVELQGAEPVGGRYPTLQTPTPEQEALLRKYDGPPYLDAQSAGGIPFMLVGGRYMWSGSPYNPAVLAGLSQATVAASLPAGTSAAAHAILVNANEITAAICAVDGNKPADVCTAPTIVQAVKALPTKAP